MKLKGTARLILRDAKTGKIDYEEKHSNTITPALANIFASNLSGTLDYSKLTPLYSKILGGVCLFNGTLDSSDVFLPAANVATLTAHAGQNSYGAGGKAADTKRGIPNNNPGRSEKVTNGYRFVWDWAQTQGNGSISGLCLTHSDTGDFWNEQSGNNTMDEDFCPVDYVGVGSLSAADFTSYSPISDQDRIPVGFYDDLDHVISFKVDSVTKKVRIYISKFTGTGVWLWNELGEPENESSFDITLPYATETDLKYYFAYDGAHKTMYWFAVTNDVGQTLSISTVDLEAKTVTSVEADCSSTLGALSIINPQTPYCPIEAAFVDGYAFITCYQTAVYPSSFEMKSLKIDLDTPTNQVLVDGFGEGNLGNTRYGNGQIYLGNGRLMNLSSMAFKKSDGTYAGEEIHNTDLTAWVRERNFTAEQLTKSPVQFLTSAGQYADATYPRGCMLNKLYQATVFTLDNAVTKSASQTMTVEYTITQVEEDES